MNPLIKKLRRRSRTVEVPGGKLTLSAPDLPTYRELLRFAANMDEDPDVDKGFTLACKCLAAVLPGIEGDEEAAAEVLIGTGGVTSPLAQAAIVAAGIAPSETLEPDDTAEGEVGNS